MIRTNRKWLWGMGAALLFCASTAMAQSPVQSTNEGVIHNDTFWDTQEGTPIYSQGGGIFRFTDPTTGQPAWFWYGAHYREAELYRQDPSVTFERNSLVGVTCYTSSDLVHWHDRGHVMTADQIRGDRPFVGWFGRMGVAYIAELKQYALVSQHNNSVMIALSDSPLGPFAVHKHIDMTAMIGTPNTGDQTVFTDDDGRSYLVYSYGKGRNATYLSEICLMSDGTVGLKDCVQVYKKESREGNCMFKYKDRYYLCASNIYGWDSSFAYYLVSDSIYGPYLPTNDMQVMEGCEQDYAHVTQTGFFVTLHGSEQETVVYCGDRWCNFAGNGLGYNQWFPLSFRADGRPVFNSLSAWTLDAQTGRWSVAADNNYVRNASFEADRRDVPIPVKPRQEYLLGWDTEVVKGNAVSLDNPHSPRLNHRNSREDRQHVVGEHALCIADSVAFERIVSQVVAATDFVPLPDGDYVLTFRFRVSGVFSTLSAEVESGNKSYALNLRAMRNRDQWATATLPVRIAGQRAVVRFQARGKAQAQCLIDDVELKQK